MEVSARKLYLYEYIREVHVLDDGMCYSKIGIGSMHNNQPLVAHRGVDNKLVFRVFGPDRVPFNIAPTTKVYARIINSETREILIEKLCKTGPAKGIITLELTEGDLLNAVPTYYNIILVRVSNFTATDDVYEVQKPIFTDMENNVALQLEITDQALRSPSKEIVISDNEWIADMMFHGDGGRTLCYFTKRIPGARVANHHNPIHTFSIHTENFTGKLEIWATLEENPDPNIDRRWFKIHPEECENDINFIEYTGTEAYTFSGNFMWMKFRLIPDVRFEQPHECLKLPKVLIRL